MAFNNLANAAYASGENESALTHYQRSLAIREALLREAAENADYLSDVGVTINNLGVLLARQGRHREALEMFQRALHYVAQAYELKPQSIENGEVVALVLGNIAVRQSGFGLDEQALESRRRIVEVRRKLVFDNPAVPGLRADLYKAWLVVANDQEKLGQAEESRRSFQAAQAVLENIPHDTATGLFELAIIYGALAQPSDPLVESAEADSEERDHYADLAMQMLREAVEKGFAERETLQTHKHLASLREREDFRRLLLEMEVAELVNSDPSTAEEKLADREAAFNILEGLVAENPAGLRHRRTLAATRHAVGLLQASLGRIDAAEPALRAALEIREELYAEAQDDPQARLELAASRADLGVFYRSRDRHEEARPLLQRARTTYEDLHAADHLTAESAGRFAQVLMAESAPEWTPLVPSRMVSKAGATLTLQDDQSIFVNGPNPYSDLYTLDFETDLPQVAAIRLQTIPDRRLPHGSAGRFPANGNFHVAEFRLETAPEIGTVIGGASR